MRIGLYGMPTAGKSHILDRIDFMEVIPGSKFLRECVPDFDERNQDGRKEAREIVAKTLVTKNNFIMDGHYAFGDEIAFTEEDGKLYDTFLYLYISPDILKERMNLSEKNRKYLSYDIAGWQKREIEGIREYCHMNDKDFYVIDNPPSNYFGDINIITEFIEDIIKGYSCKTFADKCATEILERTKSDTIYLFDGDKTLTTEDSSSVVFDYKTNIYDGNFYSGYQVWKQNKEFQNYVVDNVTEMPVSLNEKVTEVLNEASYILTSGHEKVWKYIANYLGIDYFCGKEMSAETKFFITKYLQRKGRSVIAYGDGMNDYYMLRQADKGYLVAKKDGSISRSLRGKSLEGINLV